MKLRTFIADIIKEHLLLNENGKNTSVQLTFSNINDYHKSYNILNKNGFKPPTSPDRGNGYYHMDDNWKTIKFDNNLKDTILPLLHGIHYKIDFKKPLEYKIFNHGGHLD